MKVSIAHDYLLQFGGAERVVATWSRRFTESPIYSLAYAESRTFDIFGERRVHSRLTNRFASDNIEYLLPMLPSLAKQVKVEGDVALISTSGWAHQFDFEMPTVAYVHSPARWLYAREDYTKQLGALGRLGLAASARYLRAMDVPAMKRINRLVANSRVSQSRIKSAYGIDSEIIHPPVEQVRAQPVPPSMQLPEVFALVVSRNRGYKNSKLAIESCAAAGIACVVVGSGTESYDERATGVIGLGRVTDGELKWLYQNAEVLVGSAHEDFGLTVLEANMEGTPVAAIPYGGYLETVSHGVSGYLAAEETTAALSVAISEARTLQTAACSEWAERFSIDAHMDSLMTVLQNA